MNVRGNVGKKNYKQDINVYHNFVIFIRIVSVQTEGTRASGAKPYLNTFLGNIGQRNFWG